MARRDLRHDRPKVGTRRYWEDWAKDIAAIAERHITRINALLTDHGLGVSEQFDQFLAGLRARTSTTRISRDDAIDMLAQHLITRPVFDALFGGLRLRGAQPGVQGHGGHAGSPGRAEPGPRSRNLEGSTNRSGCVPRASTTPRASRRSSSSCTRSSSRQRSSATREKLGIVYTPVEIVDFILRSVERCCAKSSARVPVRRGRAHARPVHRAPAHSCAAARSPGLIPAKDLPRKYTQELHANEILLLAYYIAAVNIEATYHGIIAQHDSAAGYVPFDGIVLTDTFHMSEDGGFDDHLAFPANSQRALAQRALDIRVIIANPPYSVGQTSGNDNNANLRYPVLDAEIANTYAAKSTAANKNSLYNSYIRAFRWASDRIKDQGIIGFVSNGGFIDDNAADGFRKSLTAEFTSIYIFNLRGNQRTAGELSRREGGKIFGSGSRNTVAITLLVKNPNKVGSAEIHYRDIGDYLDRRQKLDIVNRGNVDNLDWSVITPNAAGDWINQRNDAFQTFQPLSPKEDSTQSAIFNVRSAGL